MADYREISQQYAQGAIKAGLVLNGGAAIALLSQAGELVGAGIADDVSWAMLWWVAGTFSAAWSWMFGFSSTRLVDKSEREAEYEQAHLWWSDLFMNIGVTTVAISLICYIAGAGILAWSMADISGQISNP